MFNFCLICHLTPNPAAALTSVPELYTQSVFAARFRDICKGASSMGHCDDLINSCIMLKFIDVIHALVSCVYVCVPRPINNTFIVLL